MNMGTFYDTSSKATMDHLSHCWTIRWVLDRLSIQPPLVLTFQPRLRSNRCRQLFNNSNLACYVQSKSVVLLIAGSVARSIRELDLAHVPPESLVVCQADSLTERPTMIAGRAHS